MAQESTHFIHPTAIVDEGARVGPGSRIWHFCHVMPEAVIGSGCSLGQNVFVGARVRIEDGVKIQNNVSVYEGVHLENNVFVGPSVVFTNVINPRSSVERKHQYRSTVVKEGASIGANATIICGNEIGEYAFIGAGTVVTRDVRPFELLVGNPGRHAGWMSKAGHKLHFDDNGLARCPESGDLYQIMENGVSAMSEQQ